MRKIILSQEQTDNILTLYKSGLGETKIHKQLGISIRHIRRTLKENNISIIGTKRNYVDEAFFESISNEEKSYWLGFLFADGYVRIRRNKYGELKLKLQTKDKCHIQLFKDTIKSTNVIKDITEKCTYKGKIKKVPSTTFSIYCSKIVNDLISLGCLPNKSKLIKFPDKIAGNLIHHFIRGYFDGDGSIFFTKKNSLQFYICSGSEIFLKGIESEFNKIGVSYQTIKENSNGVFLLRTYKINDMKVIYNYIYNNANVYLKRKKLIYEKINGAY